MASHVAQSKHEGSSWQVDPLDVAEVVSAEPPEVVVLALSDDAPVLSVVASVVVDVPLVSVVDVEPGRLGSTGSVVDPIWVVASPDEVVPRVELAVLTGPVEPSSTGTHWLAIPGAPWSP